MMPSIARGYGRLSAVGWRRTWAGVALIGWLAAGCASPRPVFRPPPPDPELIRLAESAHQVLMHAGPERAIPLYREALRRARALDADSAIRPLAFNLAACLFDAGEPARAAPLLDEALMAARRGGQPEAEIRLLQARIAAGTDDREAAGRAIEKARAAVTAERRRDALPEMALLEAESAVAAGEMDAARAALHAFDQTVSRRTRDGLHARAEAVRAQGYEAEERWADAARAWDARSSRLGAAGWGRGVPPALERAARAWERAGESEAAAERWYRAARAWAAQGREETGATAMDRARALTESDTLRAALDALGREGETD